MYVKVLQLRKEVVETHRPGEGQIGRRIKCPVGEQNQGRSCGYIISLAQLYTAGGPAWRLRKLRVK